MSHHIIQNLERKSFLDTRDVLNWSPPDCGNIDICIDRLGRWFHEGIAFERESISRFFAKILRKEGEAYYLVTPVEKWKIRVEDAPFYVMDYAIVDNAVEFITTTGDSVKLTLNNPIINRTMPNGHKKPYVHIRHGLIAAISTNVYYVLAEESVLHNGKHGIMSDNHFISLE